jgi:hypothetical protein
MSARELYDKAIRKLPPLERLRLASMILDDLAASAGAELDISDAWSDQDIADVAAFSLKHAGGSAPHEDSNG